jgi:glutathione S-transferase
MILYAHPFSSYCQKVLIALYESSTSFDYRLMTPGDSSLAAELETLWPLERLPVLVDGSRTIPEATVIIEYLDLRPSGRARMIPVDPHAALEVRLLDRFFDNYVMTPMQRIVADAIRTPPDRDPMGVAEARELLDVSYAWLDRSLVGRRWAAGEEFGLADCAAAPSLFYADWVHPIAAKYSNVRAYRGRLLARPSFARAVDEARPYRSMFPPGAPDRD